MAGTVGEGVGAQAKDQPRAPRPTPLEVLNADQHPTAELDPEFISLTANTQRGAGRQLIGERERQAASAALLVAFPAGREPERSVDGPGRPELDARLCRGGARRRDQRRCPAETTSTGHGEEAKIAQAHAHPRWVELKIIDQAGRQAAAKPPAEAWRVAEQLSVKAHQAARLEAHAKLLS